MWSAGLKELTHLEMIKLKTYGPLIVNRGNRAEEKRIVSLWCDGGDRNALRRISLWYSGAAGGGESSAGTLAAWLLLRTGAWKRVATIHECSHTELFD